MKHLGFLLLILSTFSKISSAQKIELINSGELIKKGAMKYDSGEYKKALSLYNQVSRSDTNYVWSLYEKALAFEADSQYNQAIKYCQEGLSLQEQREYEPDLLNTYGNTLNDMGQPEKALKVFDSAIAKYPSYSLFYYNKGIVLAALNRLNEAELLFKKTLMINPYMYSAHFQLGATALKQGKLIPSLLSFTGYLLVNPEGKYWSKSINLLNQISRGTDDIVDYKNKRTLTPDENYQAVEDIVLSKIALDKTYKPLISLDDPISRQIQAVFEKLEYREDDNDFWIQYYLPYFKKVYNEGRFEPFINRIFSNVNIAAIQDYKKKNKKTIEVLTDDAATYFNLLRSSRELFYKRRDTVSEKYYYENGKLVGRGVLVNSGKTLNGLWDFYYPAGNLKGRGNYNITGGREGDWLFYFASGKLKGKEHYNTGKLEDGQEYYFDNGNMSSKENYINGQLEGLASTYYYAGNIKSKANYKLGKKEGEDREYYSNGNLYSVSTYANDILTGVYREYNKGGAIKEVEQFNNGKGDGDYKSYYESGNLSVTGQNMKDNSYGEWKYFYENGKMKEKRNYINNIEEGLHEEYFDNGQVSGTYVVKKGKINGDATYYYRDGKTLAKYVYDNGVIKSAKYLDKAGLQISSSEMKNNLINIVSYANDGFKRARFSSDRKGNLDGPDTLFYPSGKINQTTEYKNGELNGPVVSYYLNGKKKSEINMNNGKENGYYMGFYVNGQTEIEGWIKDGKDQGEWDYYDEKGRLITRSYYLDNDLDGYKEEFLPNSQKKIEQKYHRGWLEKMTQYDSSGVVLAVDSFPKASGKFTLLYPNKRVMAEGNYTNGDFTGSYKTYFFDGGPESTFFYRNGLRDSTYTSFYYGGVKNTEGHYKSGNKSGVWKVYDEDGKLYSTTTYVNDIKDGQQVYYFPNGNKDAVSIYKDDQLDSVFYKYDQEGTLVYQTIFKDGNAREYTYLGKDGKLVPPIPLAIVNGVLKSYYPNGKVSRECYYSDGRKNGLDNMYYSNGQVRSVDSTVFGISEGIYKEYYQDGKLKSEYHCEIDKANGICREYDDKGILKKEILYDNGLYHGPVKYYDSNGKPSKTMLYNYGTLISVKNEK
jgi:antitoxin component YwqK of YwqJK toxin-antitoxin module/Tfp pilus assembly protein PilF